MCFGDVFLSSALSEPYALFFFFLTGVSVRVDP